MKLSGFIGFVIGAAAGSAITYYKVSQYYESIIEDEVNSVREMFERRHKVVQLDDGEEISGADNKPDLNDYVSSRERTDYTKFFKGGVKDDAPVDVKEEEEELPTPYIISEEAFNEEKDEYDKLSLTFYADGVLTDDGDVPIDKEKQEELIGNALCKFDDTNVNVVYVRNDMLCTDYEICRDLEDY